MLDDDGLVVAGAHDVGHAHEAVAVLAGDDAAVGDLPAALGVERRLGELDDRAPVLPAQAGDRRVLLEVLVAGEGRRLALDGERAGHDPRARLARARALLAHQALEVGLARERHAALGGDLARELDREAVGVVQAEGVGARDRAGGQQVVEQPRALLQRAPEALLLGAHPLVDRLVLGQQLGVAGAHEVDDEAHVLRQEAVLDADAVALQQRAAHDPAQHVAAVLVGGHDAVGDEEGHAARVVGQDPQRALVGLAGGEVAPERHERQELVGLEDRVDALLDHGHAVEAQARVDVLGRQRGERADRILVVLHEDEVPVLQEALVVAAREVVGRAPLQAAVEVELAARPARARSAPPARSSPRWAAG